MKKAIYIHGLGGKGTGGSASNVRAFLSSEYDVEANTYNLLNPRETFEQIKKDCEGKDLIVASSLGAFYAACLDSHTPTILLNPCLIPQESIDGILRPDQRADFDKEETEAIWTKMTELMWSQSEESKELKIGVFGDRDEYFNYQEAFDTIFMTSFRCDGPHELAKFPTLLRVAMIKALALLEPENKLSEAVLNEGVLNLFFADKALRNKTNRDRINKNMAKIWELLDRSYAYLSDNKIGMGGAGGLHNVDEFIEDCIKSDSMIKVFKDSGDIVAAAVYNLKRGGRKLSLMGCEADYDPELGKWVPTKDGKTALYKLALEDTQLINRHRQFWGEVSDGAEKTYRYKTDAEIIPAYVMKDLMPDKHVDEDPGNINPIVVKNGKIEIDDYENQAYQRPLLGKMHKKLGIRGKGVNIHHLKRMEYGNKFPMLHDKPIVERRQEIENKLSQIDESSIQDPNVLDDVKYYKRLIEKALNREYYDDAETLYNSLIERLN